MRDGETSPEYGCAMPTVRCPACRRLLRSAVPSGADVRCPLCAHAWPLQPAPALRRDGADGIRHAPPEFAWTAAPPRPKGQPAAPRRWRIVLAAVAALSVVALVPFLAWQGTRPRPAQ